MQRVVVVPADPSRSEVYAEWVRAHEPGGEGAARLVLDGVRERISRAYPKAGRALEELAAPARGLPAAHLPWYWDTVAHRFASWDRRAAGRAYASARAAEREHQLPVDVDWRRRNVLFLAGVGALPAKELSGHQAWLGSVLEPVPAHEEFVRVLTAWAASPGELPADLARRIRASARAAGLGGAEEARVLARTVGAARGKAVPDRLLDEAAGPLAAHLQGEAELASLLELFPESKNDAAAWLRLLLRSGAAEAVVAGRVVPEGGPGGWLGRFTRSYGHRKVPYGGVARQPVPAELLEIVALFAPRLRAGGPVVLHEDRWRWPGLDADLLDACLAEGITVVDPGEQVRLSFWEGRSRRDLKALAADPVFGPRLEGTVHAGLRGGGTAITRLPENPGIAAGVHSRVEGLLDALAGGGLAAADEAVTELAGLLDRPTATALDGIEEALAALDLTGPLARALRAGLPEELGWPALEEAVAATAPAGVVGVTCTWPVLTVYGPSKAVAVAPDGIRASFSFALPEGATGHTAHYVGGSFLIGWTEGDGTPLRAFWSDRPEDVFVPERQFGMRPYGGSIRGGLGYQFETADGGGRHDGERVLRPGGREGIGRHDYQMGDGTRVWSSEVFDGLKGWARVDPITGERTPQAELPPFHTAELPPGTAHFGDHLILAALPAGAPASPLGQDGPLTGCRVLHRTPYAGPSPTEFVLEGVDGRRARYRSGRPGRRPWGILRLPQGGEDAVLAGGTVIRCHSAVDGSLLWETHGFPTPGSGPRDRHAGHAVGPYPPPAFWHFLTPRDPAASATLRVVGRERPEAVRGLLETAVREGDGEALRAGAARLLTTDAGGTAGPGGTADAGRPTNAGHPTDGDRPADVDPRIVDGVVRAALLAAGVLRRREELSRRVAIMRAGPVVELPRPVPDAVLAPALGGLLPRVLPYGAYVPGPHPATLTAVAAEGRRLRGEIDEETRRLALPAAPAPWTALLGSVDAVAWRAVVGTTSEEERAALTALLETWAAQPFAEAGGRWRTGPWTAGSPDGPVVRPAPTSGPAESAGSDPRTRAEADPETDLDADADADAEAEAGAGPGVRTVSVTRDEAGRLPRLLECLERNGPLALAPEAVDVFVRRTGARRAVAALVWGGLPYREGHDEHLKALRAAPFKADKAMAGVYDGLRQRLGDAGCRAVLAAGVPEDPAALWEPGGPAAAAARMAEVWVELLGAEEYVDEELVTALEEELGLGSGWARALTGGPEAAARAVPSAAGVLVGTPSGGVALHHTGPDGGAGRVVFASEPPHVAPASVVVWALTELPVGHPAAAGAAAVRAVLRDRLDDPRWLVPLGKQYALGRAVDWDETFGPYVGTVLPCPRALYREDTVVSTVHDDGVFVVSVPGRDLFLRPAALGDPAGLARAERVCEELDLPHVRAAIDRLLLVRGDGPERMLARAADGPVPAGRYELDPSVSVPELVAEVAGVLGVGAEAAALYLQLLALARPTDRNVRRWNGWSPARHKAAQAELVAAGAVEPGRRARAGRGVFVPGPWSEPKAPHLPLESAKLGAYGLAPDSVEPEPPFLRLLSPVPPHELFTAAWRSAPR
ncbi:hypothetical protein [Streptomyces sp. NPDC097619]|uniref:hypothetical protein n=1 Tax=Streptomyces sp. NPDC097619 TaxID=3157228 RepID=UPI003329D085